MKEKRFPGRRRTLWKGFSEWNQKATHGSGITKHPEVRPQTESRCPDDSIFFPPTLPALQILVFVRIAGNFLVFVLVKKKSEYKMEEKRGPSRRKKI